ncbi:SDR family oxidoreductase [Desulfobacula sp.]|uniref:SDR family oxidoreductase n=1 Tax=Desulfobacula sp. TaxID=2593537 RepID=UPI00260D15A9|nr:SDR family oxidoreductase [Desulfobacula sp.]
MSKKFPRVAIVTGATSGIGEATAKKFIDSGFGIVGSGRNQSRLEMMEKKFKPNFSAVVGDAADEVVLDRLFSMAAERFGQPADIVVVNAGRGLGGSVKDADLSELEEMIQVNVTAALKLMQWAARNMEDRQKSRFPDAAADIVVIGSVAGRHVSEFSTVYGASKAAVHALTEGLRRELSSSGVRVSLVEPGACLTGFQSSAGYGDDTIQTMVEQFGPLLDVIDIANTIHYIISQPPQVHLCNAVVRPTRMNYP